MKNPILLDTNALLYWLFESERLGTALKLIKGRPIFVSLISCWEVTIKHQVGKLPLPIPLAELLNEIENGFTSIDLQYEDLQIYSSLPLHHRDPFDRLLLSQCMQRKMTLLSSDRQLEKYAVDLILI